MKVRWLLSALNGLRSVRFYVADDNPRAAAATANRIEQTASRLTEFPNSGRKGKVPGTREIVMAGLPYVLVYRFAGSEVQILRLFYQKQDRQ